jgi:hypothetical protein
MRADALPLDRASITQTVRHVAAKLGYGVHDITVYQTETASNVTHVGFDVIRNSR